MNKVNQNLVATAFVLFLVLSFTLPKVTHAAAVNTATNINVTPGTQYTSFKGVPVYRLRVTNAGDASDTITSLTPTPVGDVNDTVITLHFFKDTNANSFVDQGDVDLGASASFASDNTKQVFDITDVTVPALSSRDILITADGISAGNAQIFHVSFALGTDILMGTVAISNTGDFPFQNASPLTASDTAPSLSVTDGASDPGSKTATVSETGVTVKQLTFTAAATSDSIVSLAVTPAGSENDTTNISNTKFYIDNGTPGVVDGADILLEKLPVTYTGDNTKTVFTFTNPFQIASNSSINILYTYDLGAGVVGGNTLTARLVATTDAVAGSGIVVSSNSSDISSTITIAGVDITPPTVTVTMDDDTLNIGDTSLVTFTFSETPVGFTTADVTVANGAIGAIDASDPLIQTATFTPTNGIEDTTNIITVGTAWTDTALNAGVGDDSPNYTIDTIAPTVTVTMSDTVLTVGETALVTFTFSETPVGFTTADVTVANGSIGAIDISNPLVQTAMYTPTDAITDATNIITVGTAWTDTALNAGVGDDSPNYTINTVAPQLTVTKIIINDNGGTETTFPLFIDGMSVTSGIASTTSVGVRTVSETSNSGYTSTIGGDCAADGTITLTAGDVKICTITNDDIAPVVASPSSGGGGGGGGGPSPIPPLIDLVKVPSPLALPGGSGPVTYTYTLRNIGMISVANITMVDDTCSPIGLVSGDINVNDRLDVDETWTYNCFATLTKTHTNIVTAIGWGWERGWANGISATDIANATVVVGLPLVPPLIHVTKVPNPLVLSSGGGIVTYTNKVTNPGTVALSNVQLTDDKCGPVKYISGDANNNSRLDTTETWTYTCQTNLSKTTVNTVTAKGVANGLSATDFAIVTVVVASSGATVPEAEVAVKLPNTGIGPDEKSIPWNIIVPTGIFVILTLFYFSRRKQTI